MKAAIVHASQTVTTVTIQEIPVPKPDRDDVLIRVVVFGTNPKDWKAPLWFEKDHNSGDDVTGVVEAVGEDVFQFKKGDRVAGFHPVLAKTGGAFAEYALVPSHTTFHIPPTTSFEEAATIPLAALTAAFGLFKDMRLPMPWQANLDGDYSTPLIIYGASTAVGAFAIKLAHIARIHPLIAVGSSSSEFIREYLDPAKGDALVDYTAHSTHELLISAVMQALTAAGPLGGPVRAFDCVSAQGSYDKILTPVLSSTAEAGTGRRPLLVMVLDRDEDALINTGLDVIRTRVGQAHWDSSGRILASVWCNLFSRGLQEGWFKPHPFEVMPAGLDGLEATLQALRDGAVRAKKMVGRVDETPDLQE